MGLLSPFEMEEVKEEKAGLLNEEEENVICNEVYVWGDDSRGQLGLSGIFGEESVFNVPQICSFNVIIKQLSCGLYHTVFGADNGLLYSMGCNRYGQLGIGDRESQF
jgi:alpha-tubulin suppressor-like RCC1 family protein